MTRYNDANICFDCGGDRTFCGCRDPLLRDERERDKRKRNHVPNTDKSLSSVDLWERTREWRQKRNTE